MGNNSLNGILVLEVPFADLTFRADWEIDENIPLFLMEGVVVVLPSSPSPVLDEIGVWDGCSTSFGVICIKF